MRFGESAWNKAGMAIIHLKNVYMFLSPVSDSDAKSPSNPTEPAFESINP